MKKLSKEQVEWLKEQFSKTDWRNYEDPCDWPAEVLNQCTEKEFPELLMNIDSATKLLRVFTKADPITNQEFIVFMHKTICYDQCDIFRFTPEEFKQFAYGVIDIVNWIAEQELE